MSQEQTPPRRPTASERVDLFVPRTARILVGLGSLLLMTPYADRILESLVGRRVTPVETSSAPAMSSTAFVGPLSAATAAPPNVPDEASALRALREAEDAKAKELDALRRRAAMEAEAKRMVELEAEHLRAAMSGKTASPSPASPSPPPPPSPSPSEPPRLGGTAFHLYEAPFITSTPAEPRAEPSGTPAATSRSFDVAETVRSLYRERRELSNRVSALEVEVTYLKRENADMVASQKAAAELAEEKRLTAEKAERMREFRANLVRVPITLVILVVSLMVILSRKGRYPDAALKWATGAIGYLVGYWLK